MGFPVGCTEVFFPSLLLHALSFLGFIRYLIFSLFRFLGMLDFLETETIWVDNTDRTTEHKPVSALLIEEFLPAMKFQDVFAVIGAGGAPESCAVCLYEFEGEDEIRWLKNCKHIFHRTCLDRWMEHDQKTCPLCRTQFVPGEMRCELDQRPWAALEVPDFYSEEDSEYSSV